MPLDDCVVVASPVRGATPAQLVGLARWLLGRFTGRCWLGVELLRQLDDEMWLYQLREASELSAIPLVAVGDVYMHVRSRKPLHDVMTATRIGQPLTECGRELQVNAERHLRTRLRLSQTFPADLLAQTLQVAERCSFSLDELKYQYPDEVVPAGRDADALPAPHHLRRAQGGAGRTACRPRCSTQIEHELALIDELHYEHYFLTVYDIVGFARSRHILCQGRGSAANSVVCYCLGVTEVDPARMSGAVRALHQQGAQRAAGHRRRLRARAARRGHPVPLRQVRPRPRGADGRGHHLPAEVRDPRCGQGAGHRPPRSSTRWPRTTAGGTVWP